MRRCAFPFCCAMLAALLGCSPADDGGPTRVPASVAVTYNGSPVEGASITLVPKAEGEAAYGMTDASGVAQLSTRGENDGAIPGEYQVLISKSETKSADVKIDSNEVGAMPSGADAMKQAETRHLVPEKYSAIGTTDLTATIDPSGKNALSFDLKD